MQSAQIKMGSIVAIHDGTKDVAKVTNGTDAGGVFVPTEGAVYRLATLPDGSLGVWYAIRKLPSADLLTLSETGWDLPTSLTTASKAKLTVHFHGRI